MQDYELCGRCKGKGLCGGPCKIMASIKQFLPKPKLNFSGDSPPEIFVGRYNYPEINAGILGPDIIGNTEDISMPEAWYEQKFGIQEILNKRMKLIYSRFKTSIKFSNKKFIPKMQEISMAQKPVLVDISLVKKPKISFNLDSHAPIIGNPAPLKDITIDSNVYVNQKVDYLVQDKDILSINALKELYSSKVKISNIIKVFSAGLLGKEKNRKLVPTRWSITAVDDTLSKELLKKIRYYPEISEVMLFHNEYLGNHYEILLLPDKFSFEVIEAKLPGSVYNPEVSSQVYFYSDYEGFNGRKNYADNVTGAYYSNRLAVCEYLDRIKRQAAVFIMREVRPEYFSPLGVGILREASRDAFNKNPEKFNNVEDAIVQAQRRMKLPASAFVERSWLIKNFGKQKRLGSWF